MLGAGLEVSPICLGIVRDPRVVSAAFDAGINFFFVTTDLHWPLYEPLRRGLADLLARGGAIRDQIVVAACSYLTQPEFLGAPFIETLHAVPGLDRLDVMVAGGAYGHEIDRRWQAYAASREVGVLGIRAVGASFHDRPAAAGFLARDALDVAFVRYNARHPGAEHEVFPHLPANRRALLYAFKTAHLQLRAEHAAQLGLDDEYWIPSVTDLYRFALSRAELDGCLISLAEVGHVAALHDALAEGPLSDDEDHHVRQLINAVYPRPAE
ncbi:MAG TPA: hypothetical protein VFP84_11840 [Kofleriaceae bacterium]|nr:hypothetical protein [Kofleriaceae bacterium]